MSETTPPESIPEEEGTDLDLTQAMPAVDAGVTSPGVETLTQQAVEKGSKDRILTFPAEPTADDTRGRIKTAAKANNLYDQTTAPTVPNEPAITEGDTQ